MPTFLACLMGEKNSGSHFDKTIHNPIINEQYHKIIWGLNKATLKQPRVDKINNSIRNGEEIWFILYPSKSGRVPYAICSVKNIKKRNLGPLISLDETNEERGWTNGTSSGQEDFTYDIVFNELYLLNESSFDGLKFKGQNPLSELKKNGANAELLTKIQSELQYIKRYIKPIICTF